MKSRAATLLLCLILPSAARSLSPTGGFHAWVAGTGDRGGADGPFMVAQFDHPAGIVHEAGKERLWVVDSGSGALRCIDLADKNSTRTMPLRAEGGGVFKLTHPTRLEWLDPGRTLLCLDAQAPGLALIDIQTSQAHWVAVSPSAEAKSLFLGASSFHLAAPGQVLIAYAARPQLTVLDLASGVARSLPVQGLAGTGLDDLMSAGPDLYGVARSGFAPSQLYRIDGVDLTSTAAVSGQALAVSLTPQGLDRPWSFVRGAPSLSMGCDAAGLMAVLGQDGAWKVWHLIDPWGRRIGLENDDQPLVNLKVPVLAPPVKPTFDPQRVLVREPGYLCEDARGDKWYLSDTPGNRILCLRRTEPEEIRDETYNYYDGYMESAYAPQKTPGTRRIALFGSSYFLRVADLNVKARTFAKRLEWYLNLFSSMSNGPRYEVMAVSHPFGEKESLYSMLRREEAKLLVKYQVDDILLCYQPRDLASIVDPYLHYPPDASGLPVTDWDPDYDLRKRKASDIKDPAYLALEKYVQALPRDRLSGLFYAENGLLTSNDAYVNSFNFYARDMQDPGLLERLEKFHVSVLKRIWAEVEATAQKRGQPVSLTALLVPELQGLGYQETYIDDPREMDSVNMGPVRRLFKDFCGDTGARRLDLVDEARVYSMDQPFVAAEYHHMGANGCDLMALITAKRYLEGLPGGH